MRKWIAVVVLMFVASSARAQAPSLEAHRLYFTAITSDANDNETPVLARYLDTAGVVGQGEHRVAVEVLLKFKRRYGALVTAYNNSPSTLAGNNDDTALFLAQQDILTQTTIELLQGSLSEKSFKGLVDRIGRDSRNIKRVEGSPIAQHLHGAHVMLAQNGMTPHYTIYHTDSYSSDGNGGYYITSTAEVSGYTSCSYCPYFHQGYVTNTLAGGGTNYGPRVTAPSQIDVTNQRTGQLVSACMNPIWPSPPDECIMNFEEGGKIQCTSLGSIALMPQTQFNLAQTWTKEAVGTGGPPYQETANCQPGYSPPDFWDSLNSQQPNGDYWYSFGLIARTACFYCSFTGIPWNTVFHFNLTPPNVIQSSIDLDQGANSVQGACTCWDCGHPHP